jgi:hypothetical protein
MRRVSPPHTAAPYGTVEMSWRTVAFLERAVAAGFNDRRLLASDENLASLRSLPRFQALVERLKPPE